MAIKTLVFDWDGTLHNTKHLYGCAFRAAYQWLVENGYAPEHSYSDDDVSIYLGMNAPLMWNTFMPQLPQEVKEYCSNLVGTEMVKTVLSGNAILYPGALEALQQIKDQGYHLVFLSNCKHPYMEAHRKMFQLDRFFEGFYCSQDFGFIPKEEIFLTIQKDFPGEYLAIGDRAGDLKIAFTHGFSSIGCSYGFGTSEELAAAALIANDVSELPELIARVGQKERKIP